MTDSPSLAAEASNPATAQARLAEIAQSHPELQAAIAANPACYPGLLDWIDSVGDAAAKHAVAVARGAVAPAAPVNPFAQTAPVNPFAVPATTAAAQPLPAAAAPRTAAGPTNRKPLFIGLAAVLVVLLVGGGVAFALFFSKFGGASSPEAAVSKALDAVKNMDAVALYGSLSPAELGSFSAAIDELKSSSIQQDDEQTDYAALLQEVASVTEITIDDLEFDTDELGEGVVAVTITDGSFEMDTDTEVMARALNAVTAETYRANQDNWGYSDSEIDDMIDNSADYLEDSLDDAMPIEFDADDVEDNLGFQLTLISVQEGGSWYISPLLSYLELLRDQANRYDSNWDLGDLPDADDVATFETPEDAVAGLLDGGESLINDGDIDDLVAALPLAERRAVALYGDPMGDNPGGWNGSWSDLELSIEQNGSTALAQIDSLSVDIDTEYDSISLDFEGVCADWQTDYNSGDGCLDDLNYLDELGIGDARLVVVQENGSWFVSPLQTGGYISSIMANRFAELARDGDLDKLSNY